MPLYLGLDCSTHDLSAIVIEIAGERRRIVLDWRVNFDRDLPEYGTTGGVRREPDSDAVITQPVMWADALDRMMARLASAAEIDVGDIRVIAGSAHQHAATSADPATSRVSRSFDPLKALAPQLSTLTESERTLSTSAFLASLLGTDHLSRYWQRRYSLPAAALIPWSSEMASRLIGTGIIREGLLAVSLGTIDNAVSRAADAPIVLSFRNASVTREWMRLQYRLEWSEVDEILSRAPIDSGRIMLPWLEPEITPCVTRAGLRRFGFDAHDRDANITATIEGQMMAIANHADASCGVPIERVIATGAATANRSILQVMANVFGVDVYRLDAGHAAALGAALRAYHADMLDTGTPVTWSTVVSGFTDPHPGHRVSPNPRHAATYASMRKDYAMLERLHQHRDPIC